jgi:hypothetical protein
VNPLAEPRIASRQESFRVLAYSPAKLSEILCEGAEDYREAVKTKRHLDFFKSHLERIGLKTIVVECSYIDHDYMEDYAAYYVRCFAPYQRECRRLHFFSNSFKKMDFIRVLQEDGNQSDYKNGYLGFIVVRPLPFWIFGRTCLKPPPENIPSNFPTLRAYRVNLFGLELKVESLAFQEQDCAVSVCATSALWSVFQKTGIAFHHTILSPVEITKISHSRSPSSVRELPISTLNSEQLAGAISVMGLDPFLFRLKLDSKIN